LESVQLEDYLELRDFEHQNLLTLDKFVRLLTQ